MLKRQLRRLRCKFFGHDFLEHPKNCNVGEIKACAKYPIKVGDEIFVQVKHHPEKICMRCLFVTEEYLTAHLIIKSSEEKENDEASE